MKTKTLLTVTIIFFAALVITLASCKKEAGPLPVVMQNNESYNFIDTVNGVVHLNELGYFKK